MFTLFLFPDTTTVESPLFYLTGRSKVISRDQIRTYWSPYDCTEPEKTSLGVVRPVVPNLNMGRGTPSVV